MSDDTTPTEKVVQFPPSLEEERNRRILGEAARLADLAPGEWKLWFRRKAEEFDIKPEVLAELVEAQIAARKKAAAEKMAQEKLSEQRAERQRKSVAQEFRENARAEDAREKKAKKKSKAFADIIKLSADQQDGKIAELAKRLEEDEAALTAEFAEYRDAKTESGTKSGSEWDIDPWPESVTAAVVLEELIARINAHIVAKPHEVLVIALWIMMAWVHDAAHYSVYLVATSPVHGCGKTTLIIEVIGRLAPKPEPMGANPTEASIFYLTDREHPTLLGDNFDKLFASNKDVTDLFLNGWTRGIPVRRTAKINGERVPVCFDVFAPKAVSLTGTKIPPALLSRCLVIKLLRAMPGEDPAEVDPFDEELMAQFKVLKSKLARWANDNLLALKTAAPVFPAGLTTRAKNNAKLLLAIAELADPEWAKMARTALERLLREEREPSWLERLLQEAWVIFFEEKHKAVESEVLIKRLTADPTSEWCNYQGKGRRPNQWDIGFLLKGVGVFSCQVGKRRVGGYHLKDFLENQTFERWLGRQPLNPSPEPKKKTVRSKAKKTQKRTKARKKRKVRG
jgi:hypothetical protein